MSLPTIDLNCDMGEGYGAWTMGEDLALLEHVSSANIACGFHAGDPATMRRVVNAAVARGVCIGAHPGLPDLQGFGRRVMQISPAEAYAITVYQVGALAGFAAAAGTRLHHVKPHGALYNMAAKDRALADALAQAVHDVDPALVFYGLAGSAMVDAAQALGLRTAQEVFADRAYDADGSLAPRGTPGALIEDPALALAQVRALLAGRVQARDGTMLTLRADTLCLHGDQPGALAFATLLRKTLGAEGVRFAAPSMTSRTTP